MHTIDYRATNRAGVTSAARTATVKTDVTPPSVDDHDPVVSPIGTYARHAIDLTSTVSDAVSGIASTSYRIAPAGTPETSPTSDCPTWGTAAAAHFDTTSMADGSYVLRTIAVDNARNGICSPVHACCSDFRTPATFTGTSNRLNA